MQESCKAEAFFAQFTTLDSLNKKRESPDLIHIHYNYLYIHNMKKIQIYCREGGREGVRMWVGWVGGGLKRGERRRFRC